MLNWVFKRLSEPSTLAGVAAIGAGVGQVIGDSRVTEGTNVVVSAAQVLASGDQIGAGVALVAGLLAMFKKEKGGL